MACRPRMALLLLLLLSVCCGTAAAAAASDAATQDRRLAKAKKELTFMRYIQGKGKKEREGFGPTAHFLEDDLNLEMSCAVCTKAFRFWSKRMDREKDTLLIEDPANPGQKVVDRDAASKFYHRITDEECKRMRQQFSFAWHRGRPAPADRLLRMSKIPAAATGREQEQTWSEQFIHHRCDWLADKFAVPLSIQIADTKLPGPTCPMVDCASEEPAAKGARKAETSQGGDADDAKQEL